MKIRSASLLHFFKKAKASLLHDEAQHAVFISNWSLPNPSQANGFLLSPQLVITAKHCVEDELSKYNFYNSGRSTKATSVHMDEEHDIAMVILQDPLSDTFATLAQKQTDQEKVKCYATVVEKDPTRAFGIARKAIRDDGQLDALTFIEGYEDARLFQGFSRVKPGFSGAAIFNSYGEVTALLIGYTELSNGQQGIIGIPYDHLRRSIANLSEKLLHS